MQAKLFFISFIFLFNSFSFAGEIHKATEKGDLQIDGEILHYAIEEEAWLAEVHFKTYLQTMEKNFQTIENLIEKYKDDEAKLKELMNFRDEYGNTPLHVVSGSSVKDGIKLTDYTAIDMFVPFVLSYKERKIQRKAKKIRMHRSKIARLLVQNGADVNALNNWGFTPLFHAAYGKHPEITRLFMANEADVNVQSVDGKTPLHLAVQSGNEEIIELIIKKVNNPNIQESSFLYTPLHIAADRGYVAIVRVLMANGANPYIQDNNGLTPIEIAANYNYADIVEIFRTYESNE